MFIHGNIKLGFVLAGISHKALTSFRRESVITGFLFRCLQFIMSSLLGAVQLLNDWRQTARQGTSFEGLKANCTQQGASQ